MPQLLSRDALPKVRKLAQLADELRRGKRFEVTRLTSLKSLCREPDLANRFVTFLAGKTLERVEQGEGRSSPRDTAKARAHREMMAEALGEMEGWMQRPTESHRDRMRDLLGRMRDEQNEYQRISFGAVRIITDSDLLLCEYALHCLLGLPHEAGYWAYQTARHYAERYQSSFPSGLVPNSAPLVQDIVDFWANILGVDPAALIGPAQSARQASGKQPASAKRWPAAGRPKKGTRKMEFTHRQGQFLAFIRLFRKLHRWGPAELDMAKYFRVTPPSVHGMVVKLEELGLITREPGVPRSVRVALPEAEVPELEEVEGPPWTS
jgi:hypothetical protein